MSYRTRLILAVVALSLITRTASAELQKVVVKNYSFDQANGKTLPIPGDIPETCQASVGGWPFAGFANGGVFLPAVPSPIHADVTVMGLSRIGQNIAGRYCTNDGFQFVLTYCISTPTQPCARPKFLIKTKSAVLGVRG